jgi:serine phosphatase RsbU (regulator of sigma subunit)
VAVTIDLAILKTHRFGSRESGDTAEVIERPAGGISVVLVDGQGHGAAAKLLSLQVAGRVVSLLNEGVRDGAAARAAHDFLFAMRGGRVSAALDILSVDLASSTVVITRNSEVPMVLRRNGELRLVTESGGRIGLYRHTRPWVLEVGIEPGLAVVLVTDGVVSAGEHWGRQLDLLAEVERALKRAPDAEGTARSVLEAALEADRGCPQDDMSVVALRLLPGGAPQPLRQLRLQIPLPE